MKDFFVCDCLQHENKVVISSFVVIAKQVKPKKSGEPYLALTLGDRSGHLEAKMWDNVADTIDAFDQEDFIKVKGLINKYKNRFQLTIHKLRRLLDSEVEFADYLPKTTKDIGELWQTLASFVAEFQNPHLKALVEAFMSEAEIAEAYRTAPAAKSLHHAYIGGLLDHVVSLFRSCDLICRNYPQINRDLLLTGAFLHDIGKLPMFPEALVLHYLDDLDSKMEAMRTHFERAAELDGGWTGYNSSLGRPLLNSARFLEKDREKKPEVAAEESAATPPAETKAASATAAGTDENG